MINVDQPSKTRRLFLNSITNTFEWINQGDYSQAKYSKEKKEILEFLDKNSSDEFPPKDIAKGLGKISKQEVNNITRLLRKLLNAGHLCQTNKGKYRCLPF